MPSQATINIPEQLPTHISVKSRTKHNYRHAHLYTSRLYQIDEQYQRGNRDSFAAASDFDKDWAQIDKAFRWAVENSHLGEPIALLVMVLVDASSNISSLRLVTMRRIEWLQTALRLARQNKRWQALSTFLANLGACYVDIGEYAQAEECLDEAFRLIESHGFPEEQAGIVLYARAKISMYKGYYEEAIDTLKQALEKSSADIFSATVHLAVCNAFLNLQRFRQAIDHLNIASAIAEKVRKPDIWISIWNTRGAHYQFVGCYEEALEAWKKALEIAEKIEDIHSEAFLLNNIVLYELQQQEFSSCVAFSTRAIQKASERGDQQTLFTAYSNRGQAHTYLGEYDLALEDLSKAIDMEQAYENSYEIGRNLLYIAQIYMKLENFDKAQRHLQAAKTRVTSSKIQDDQILNQIDKGISIISKKKQGEEVCFEVKTRIPDNMYRETLRNADMLYERAYKASLKPISPQKIQESLNWLEEAISIYNSLGLDQKQKILCELQVMLRQQLKK
jgi:tetratricopeptide (TPR) repeat protein